MHFWSTFGDSNLNEWKVIVRTSSKWGEFRLSSKIWPWRSQSITPKNNRHLNQGVLRLSSKFGDSSVNGWWVIVRTSKWLIHTQTHGHTGRHTDAGDDNTRRPKLASGKNEITKHAVPFTVDLYPLHMLYSGGRGNIGYYVLGHGWSNLFML